MRTVEEIIAELKAIADDPKKAMEDYKKELESGRWDKFIASRRKDK